MNRGIVSVTGSCGTGDSVKEAVGVGAKLRFTVQLTQEASSGR